MKLNKYQRAWIKKLKSGTTKKAVGELIKNGGSMCCLGVGIRSMQPLSLKMCQKTSVCTLEERYFPQVYANLSLRSSEGIFDVDKVMPKWIKIIDRATDPQRIGEAGSPRSLTELNDYTSLTHAQIGEFIDQNREAVFVSQI